MVERATTLNTALNLMQRALQLLDDVGESLPAIHLQMAIDVMTNAPIPRTIEADDWTPPTPSPEAIKRAAELVSLYGDKALGRTRMQLYEAMGRRETGEVDHLAQVCSVLMQGTRQS